MYKVFYVIKSSLILLTVSGFIGCSTPVAVPEPSYPSLSEIAPIPEYTDDGRSWDTNAVCWVGVTDNARWNNIGPPYAQTQLSSEMLPLIREELRNEGYQVRIFENHYMTREKRLSVQRIILCKEFEINKTMVKEGACYDMKFTLSVMNNPEHRQNTQYEVWGRSLVIPGAGKPWAGVYRECIFNLLKMSEFRKALEADVPI